MRYEHNILKIFLQFCWSVFAATPHFCSVFAVLLCKSLVTSHNHDIIASARHRLALSGEVAGTTDMAAALRELGYDPSDQSLRNRRSLLFVEGSDDACLLKELFHFDEQQLKVEQALPYSKFAGLSKSDFNTVVQRSLKGSLVYLLDRDFAEKVDVPASSAYVWQLPMIESYLIWSQLLNATEEARRALLQSYFALPDAKDAFVSKALQAKPKQSQSERKTATRSADAEAATQPEGISQYITRRMAQYDQASTLPQLDDMRRLS